MPYKPMMPQKEARRRIAHQERVFREGTRRKKQEIFKLGEIEIRVSPSVFPPLIPSPLTNAILNEVKERDRVLDLGTGSGINAILAAQKSKDVLATDINPYAVKCARGNVDANGLSSRVKVIRSNLFEKANGKYDLIIFDPPFRWTKPRSWLERATADEGYSTLARFFSEVKEHLGEQGRIILNFGTSADMRYLRFLIKQNALKSKILSKVTIKRVGWVYYVLKITL